jgi:hypothetical protein
MKTTPPGFLTEGNYSNEALILEARWLLAFHYKWDGRCIEASRCMVGTGRLSISELLTLWDSYNTMVMNRSRRDYFISNRENNDSEWDFIEEQEAERIRNNSAEFLQPLKDQYDTAMHEAKALLAERQP